MSPALPEATSRTWQGRAGPGRRGLRGASGQSCYRYCHEIFSMRETPESSRLRHEESSVAGRRPASKYCIFCRSEKVRRVTEDGGDYFECGECGRRAERRIMLDPQMEMELRYPVRDVIEMRRGELEGP